MIVVKTRWMIERDLPAIMEIEKASFEHSWTEKDFLFHKTRRDIIIKVATSNNIVVGYVVFLVKKEFIKLLNLAVHPECRREKIGSQLVNMVIETYLGRKNSSRTHIELDIRETNLPGQLFFKNNQFRAVAVRERVYDHTTEDAYLMKFGKFYSIQNRIKDYMPMLMSELGLSG
jgi:[ribosomal protein S18]-alanine N-acetyltransferase